MKTVAQKMGLKKEMRAYFFDAPISAKKTMHLPELTTSSTLCGEFDYIHLFTKSQFEMDRTFPKLIRHLKAKGMLCSQRG